MTPAPGPRVRVVVVEDSAVQRAHLVRVLEQDRTIEVVGEAGAVDDAVAVVAQRRPDVVTMDLEIPGGDRRRPGGMVAIERLAGGAPVPILVVSAHAQSRSDTVAVEALAAGAVDVFPKHLGPWPPDVAAALRRRVVVCSRIEMVTRRRPSRATGPGRVTAATGAPVVGLAASTGGPSALRTVLTGLRGLPAPILVVQHIHADFTTTFAAWLEDVTGVPTSVATDGERPEPGHVYVAPADTHLRLAPDRKLVLDPEPDVLSRPSCDELLRSLAANAGPAAIAAVLTGMGDDGARGLLAVRRNGGTTFAQDGATAVVDGMPRAAREIGAVQRSLPVEQLADALSDAVRGGRG